jgi:hypothetical protein
MKRWLPFVILGAMAVFGMVVVVAGFIYDIKFAGFPYQDPTPEMQAKWRQNADIAATIMYSGITLVLLGIVGTAGLGVWRLTEVARND